MESQCIKVKLKEGQSERFLSWAKGLASREGEVREALLAEGMQVELMFMEKAADGDYVILYTRAQNLAAANAAFDKSSFKVDQEAKQIMAETWDFGSAKLIDKLLEVVPTATE